ncbi:GntR family transcriptional regulator [Acrocarpospora catenulata]|uniref:GntR family transcriptional regulator n=1 Tax=Acrocarpospora catenulata TaxID=2836182 RepID=UPI001BD9FB89|nr:winged helix-turn-helix domain-containing protein [Acrocarpospora catenulata]
MPLYLQIEHILRVQISDNELKAGDMLPSTTELMERFGAGRNTVNRALRVLRDANIAYLVHGRGTFVGQRSIHPPRLPIRKETKYWSIASDLIEEIRDGTHLPNEALPSVKVLTRSYGVCRAIIGRAFAVLKQQGWVSTSHGKGTFVEHEDNWPDS